MRGNITKIDQIACFIEEWEPKTWQISAKICLKLIIKMAAILEFLVAILEICRYLGWFFLLENVAPSHYLILKCKIPLNSIKQGMFILPAKFKPHFYTHACKWIGFSQILPQISLSLIKMARNQRNPTQKVKIYQIWYHNEGNVTYFPVIWIRDTLEVPSQH